MTVGEGDLSAKINVVEMLGTELNIHAASDSDEVVMIVPTASLEHNIKMGDTVSFTAKPELIQLFDQETGNNLIWYDQKSADACSPVCKEYKF